MLPFLIPVCDNILIMWFDILKGMSFIVTLLLKKDEGNPRGAAEEGHISGGIALVRE